MKRNIISVALFAVLATMAVSCQKEEPISVSPPGNNSDVSTELWPSKKISRITHSVGTFEYLTYDFTWDDSLLRDIRCTLYDGSSLGGTTFEYNGGRISRVYPYDGSGTAYTDGAMNYSYENGQLKRQSFLLPLRSTQNLCQQLYDDVVPCELTYSYSNDGRVSTVTMSKTPDDGVVETSTYEFGWDGNNVTSITCDGRTIMSNMQYDNYPNPMRFPLGIETMGIASTMILEGVFGNSVQFFGYAFCWSKNNMTTLPSSTGHCSYSYSEDGFPTSKTIVIGGESNTYTFEYVE